jgi:UDP-glucose 4-epimerase
MPKVLITGVAGFIGSHVADAYIARGWDVVGVDNYTTGKRENVPAGVQVHEVDVRDPKVIDVIRAEKPDVVNHQAAQIDVRKSMSDPRYDVDVNVGGFMNVLEGANQAGARQVVFASSGGAGYGDTDRIPTTEDHPMLPDSFYGASKAACEIYGQTWAKAKEKKFAALRYSNVYGPRQNPHGEAGVVAIFAQRLRDGQQCTLYGEGKLTRDYVFVEDVARANVMATEQEYAGAVNISSGRETSVQEVYDSIVRASAVHAEPAYAPARPGEQRRSCLDPTKAERELGWKAEVEFASGIERTVESFDQA